MVDTSHLKHIAQKVDYYRAKLLYTYGGIWLDMDTIIVDFGDGNPDDALIDGWICNLGVSANLEFDCDDTDPDIHPGVDDACGDD